MLRTGPSACRAQGKVADFGIRGIIEGYILPRSGHRAGVRQKGFARLRRATAGGADGSDDVKEFHGRRGRSRGRGELLYGLYLSGHGADLYSRLVQCGGSRHESEIPQWHHEIWSQVHPRLRMMQRDLGTRSVGNEMNDEENGK